MENVNITGKVIKIGEVLTFGNDFTKKEIVVETDDKYPQKIKVEFHKDNIDLINGIKLNDPVSFNCNLRGSEWENSKKEMIYFLSLVCWKVEGNRQEQVAGAVTLDPESDPFESDPF